MPLVAPLTATPTSSQLSTLLSSELHRLSNLQSNTPPPLSYELTAQDSPLLPQLIDHTLLAPTATIEEVHRICNEATTHGFKAVCVSSLHVGEVAKYLNSLPENGIHPKPLPCCVIGFPLGAVPLEVKIAEAEHAIRAGAKELDLVPHSGYLKAKDYTSYLREIQEIVRVASEANVDVKVIIETSLLNYEEIVAASLLTGLGGAQFVKTSTGFVGEGAKKEHVKVMWEVIRGFGGKVKASGGVRTWEKVKEMVEAGAERIGTSSGLAIVGGGKSESAY